MAIKKFTVEFEVIDETEEAFNIKVDIKGQHIERTVFTKQALIEFMSKLIKAMKIG